MSDTLRQLLADVKAAVYEDQPYLNVVIQGGNIVVEGIYLLLPVLSENADREPFAKHNIQIEISPDYPRIEPVVTMLDKSIPWKDQYHCSATGVCCITVFESWAAASSDPSVKGYLKGPLRNFFLSQLLKKQGKDWPFGEWEHGETGFIAAIADLIGCPSKRGSVEDVLRWRISSPDTITHGEALCPSETGKMLTDYSGANLEHFQTTISAEIAREWLTRIQKIRSSRTPLEIQREIHKNRPFRRVQ